MWSNELERVAGEVEWYAWRLFCEELGKTGVEINDHNRLAAAVKLWGETLCQLRRYQGPSVVLSALREAQRAAKDNGCCGETAQVLLERDLVL